MRRQRKAQQRKARQDEVAAVEMARADEERKRREMEQSGTEARKRVADARREAEVDRRRREWTRLEHRKRRERRQRLACDGHQQLILSFEEFKSGAGMQETRQSSRAGSNDYVRPNGGTRLAGIRNTRVTTSAKNNTAASSVADLGAAWAEFLPPSSEGEYSRHRSRQAYYFRDPRAQPPEEEFDPEESKFNEFKRKSEKRERGRGLRHHSRMELPVSAVEMARTSSSIVEFVTQRRRAEQSRIDHTAKWRQYVVRSERELAKEAREQAPLRGVLPPEQKLSRLHERARSCYLVERAATKKAHEEVWPTA